MQRKIQEILVQSITDYLTIDNIKPTGLGWLFGKLGAAGRERANKYREFIHQCQSATENALIMRVYEDTGISTDDKNNLHTSKQLKIRLLKGLCEFYHLNMDTINNQVRQFLTSIPGNNALIPTHDVIINIYRKVLFPYINKILLNENEKAFLLNTHSALHIDAAMNSKVKMQMTRLKTSI